LGAVAFTIVADVSRQTQWRQRADLSRGYRSYLQLGPEDDYASTIRKLGLPARTGSHAAEARVFRSLTYTARRYAVILMGPTKDEARYIGTLDLHGRVLDAVQLPDGTSGESLLNSALPDSVVLR
jgi:hypothetical protein